MAIVKMKRLRIIALASQKEELLSRLLHLGSVEVSEPQAEWNDPEWSALLKRSESALADAKQRLAQVEAALQVLQKYAPDKGSLFSPRELVEESRLMSDELLDRSFRRAAEINELERELAALLPQENRLTARRSALTPWARLDVDLGTQSTKNANIVFAVCPAAVDLNALALELEQAAPTAHIIEASSDREQRYFLYLCHRSEEEAVTAAMKPYGVSSAGIKGFEGTAAENIAMVEQELAQLHDRRAELERAAAEKADCRQDLKICADRLRQEVAKEESAQRALEGDKVVYFTCWTTVPGLAEVEGELEKFTCAWEAVDPTPEEYEEVPVKLENNKLTQPLNMITDMYVPPAYDGVDPNPLMAPFFVLFFGLMMADMAYGALMLLGGWFLLKKMRAKGTMANMGGLLILCGVSTLVFGVLTGGFFGDFIPQVAKLIDPNSNVQLPALFTPLTDTLAILIGSLALGVIQIFTGMTISVVYKVKNGDFIDALFSEIAWWVVIAGGVLAILGVGSVAGIPVLLVVGFLMLALGGTRNAKGFGKLTSLIGILYNGITGYFSDILSYARLMALMLAGAVIAQVFNTLGSVTGNVVLFVVISLVGNAINLALNLLGCYVHDLRLQCLEFFGRFYKEGTKVFKPLTIQTKYVDVIKEEH